MRTTVGLTLCYLLLGLCAVAGSFSAIANDASKSQFFQRDGLSISTKYSQLMEADRRKRKTANSPVVLDAVGQIIVLRADKRRNKCSGSLIATVPGASSRVIQSAGHCFGNTNNGEKFDIDRIIWRSALMTGQTIEKELTLKQLDLKGDSALLTFKDKIPFRVIKPLLVESEITLDPMDMLFYNEDAKIIAAGFSSDFYKGADGNVLTYDEDIHLKDIRGNSVHYDRFNFLMNTVAFNGASGGALMIYTDLTDEDIENPYQQWFYIGTLIQIDGSGSKFYGRPDRSQIGSKITVMRGYDTIDHALVQQLNQ